MESNIPSQLSPEKRDKLLRYHHLNAYVRKGQTLFVGSSLMEQFPIYEFLLDRQLDVTVYNRGIGGFTTGELLENLDVCIFDLEPRRIFMNIGTNDLNGPVGEVSLMENLLRIIKAIQSRLPETELTLLAFYPVNPEAADSPGMQEILRHRTNERLRRVNANIQALAEELGLPFLDLNDGLLDEEGRQKQEFTIDGMHMYANGYETVLTRLLSYLLP